MIDYLKRIERLKSWIHGNDADWGQDFGNASRGSGDVVSLNSKRDAYPKTLMEKNKSIRQPQQCAEGGAKWLEQGNLTQMFAQMNKGFEVKLKERGLLPPNRPAANTNTAPVET